MPTRGGNPRITIQADATPVDRAARQGEQALGRLEKSAHKTGEGLKVGLAAGAVAATAGLGAVVDQLKESEVAARASEVSQSKLEAQLKAMGVSYKAHAKQIDDVIQKTSRLSGLDDEDLQDAFTNVVRATGNVNGALKDMAVVADLARAKHLDVAKAGDLVAKVHNGNVGVLKRYGVAIDPVTKAQDKLKASTKHATDEQVRAAKAQDKQATSQKALAELTDRFSGQAKKYGDTTQGAMDKASVAWENLHEAIGAKVTPVLAKAALAFVGLLDKAQAAGPTIKRFAGQAQTAVQSAIPTMIAIFKTLKTAITGTITTITGLVRGFQQGKTGAVALVAVLAGATAAFTAYKVAVAAVATYTKIVTAVTKAWTVAQAALNFVLDANPIGLAIVAIAGLAAGLTIAYKKSETFRDIVNGAWDAIKTAAGIVFPIVKKAMQVGLLGPIGLIITHFGTFKRDGAAAFDAVKTAAGKVADVINSVKDAINGVIGVVGKVGGKVAGFFGKIGDGIGMPSGGSTALSGGNALMGARSILAPFASAAGRFGLHTSSGARPGAITVSGNRSYHADGYAIDESGSPAGMLAYFRYLKATAGPRLRELIYTPGGVGIKDGHPYRYTGAVAAQHMDHVHVAFTGGIGDGIGFTGLEQLWVQANGAAKMAPLMAHIAQAESGGDPTIDSGGGHNSPGGGTSVAAGLWQILGKPFAGNVYDPLTNAKMAVWKYAHQGLGAWDASKGAWGRFVGSGETYSPGSTKSSSSTKKGSASFPAASGTAGATGNPYVASGTGSLTGGKGQGAAPSLLGPIGAANTYTGGIDSAEYQRTLAGDDPKRLLSAILKEVSLKQTRLKKVRKALKRRLTAGTRSRLQQEATQLVGELRDLSDLAANLGTSINNGVAHVDTSTGLAPDDAGSDTTPDPYDTTVPVGLQSAAGLARLTPDTADDIAAESGIVDYFTGKLNSAIAAGDQQGIAVFANALADAKDALNGLTDAVNQNTAGQQQRDQLQQTIADRQEQLLALGNRTGDLQAQFAAWLSGSIGGRVGLGFQAAGVPGSVARY